MNAHILILSKWRRLFIFYFHCPAIFHNNPMDVISYSIKQRKSQIWINQKTRKNCFRYLKLISPLNAAICTTTYLERQKCYGPGKKILFKKQLFNLEVKGHYGMWHTALWSCTHIPNKIDLSGKTKVLVRTSFAEKQKKKSD